jgi:hypothetical protein
VAVTLKKSTGPQQPDFYWAFDLFIRECAWGGKAARSFPAFAGTSELAP